MPCLSGSLEAAAGLRVRPVPEWDGCLVYDPVRRRLTELNLTAALVLELCRGTGYAALRETFGRAIGSRLPADEVDRLLMASVLHLIGAGLVVRREHEGVRPVDGHGGGGGDG